ncbi:MAG TPA: cytochrome c oxidase subunit 3 [Candidatus Competibacteraceae bacterium]|nr:cytochrome c oxidase subunit 3 [Candidatus Competibacteraceae bacterium]MCP5134202.1 cytochrome c oxidase subunit 3 [Gammaproteobacteria bacterium]HRY18231.1 cytochrome c oxidase subunit 3 [Candidatus Competibacteraceae bacterium]
MATHAHAPASDIYYVPAQSHWPIIASISLFTMMFGGATLLNGGSSTLLFIGLAMILTTMFGWFGTVVMESEHGFYNAQMDRSFRWGMGWFIFSEVMFFAAFFGALFYARHYSVPWLGGETEHGVLTQSLLWSGYEATWPTNGPDKIGGFFAPMHAWGLPAINTLILLSSGVTITWAHWGLVEGNRAKLIKGLAATVALGVLFLVLQAVEYHEAYQELHLTLGSGIYGSTFFMLTGFHGLHVTIGAIILAVILFRSMAGHFSPHKHFAFEAAAWYWHFVDVVWLGLFIFVYWM